MAARLIPGADIIVSLRRRERSPGVPISLTDPAGALLAVAKLRYLDLRQGNADQVVAFLADHLAAADVLGQVALHLAANDLAEALVIAFNFLAHGNLSCSSELFFPGQHAKEWLTPQPLPR